MILKEIDLQTRKQILLKIMDEIHDFCINNNITYYLVGGTLLGAIRHKGFIPWDDDMDIALKRKDYERLVSEFKSLSGKVRIVNYFNTSRYNYAYAKADYMDTILIESGARQLDIGINIDIFPLDSLPGTYEQAKKYFLKINKLKNIITLKHLEWEEDRKFYKNIIVILAKVLNIIPDKIILSKIDKMSKKYKMEDSKYLAVMCGAWGVKEITNKKYFDKVKQESFAGRLYNVPVGYDEYLTGVYGDYMVPPPKSKQVTHHGSVAYWR